MSMETLAGPYISHARAERIMNRIGLGLVNQYILKMVQAKGTADVSEEMLTLEPRVRWAKIMPRERMDRVQEMVQRRTTQPPIVSLRNAVSQLSEGEDIEEEIALIEEEIAEAQRQQQELLAEAAEVEAEQQREQIDQENEREDDVMERQHEMDMEKQAMSMETQRQNMQMRLQAQKANKKKANPRQERRK